MLDLSEAPKLVPIAVITASLIGSLHCTGMCGPLVAASARGMVQTVLYHLGRLVGYVTLGALAGLLGQEVLKTPVNLIASWLATATVAVTFILLGVRSWMGKKAHLALPKPLLRFYSNAWKHRYGSEKLRASLTGLLSVLLPCGWLHSFVLAAVALGNMWSGVALMTFFWLGTVPALTAAPVLFHKVLGPLSRRAPKVTGILLITAGVIVFGMKFAPKGHRPHAPAAAPAPASASAGEQSCH